MDMKLIAESYQSYFWYFVDVRRLDVEFTNVLLKNGEI